MEKVFEVFDRDIKREFNDVTTVDRSITALDIDEYVVTRNVENILGNFVSYFFDDAEQYPNLKVKTQLLQNTYRDRIGPGVWIRGFFGAGKSHLLKVMHALFTDEFIEYEDEQGNRQSLNVAKTIQEKVTNSDVAELVGNIKPEDYMTFIFSANHITKIGDTIVDVLPKEISRQLGKNYDEDKEYSAMDVADFLKHTLNQYGKKRMLIFIDEVLDVLDTPEKVRKFEGLIELLNKDIWFIVTSLEAKTKLLTTVTAERMIHRFGQEQILFPEEMVWIVKRRYLAKKDEAIDIIDQHIKIAKLQYLFAGAYLSDTEDGKIEERNLRASYPFFPFQLAYMKELLKNESKGSARNMMKTVKSIVKNPEVYSKDIGYFVDIELIYEELKSKRSIEEEYSDLILSLAGTPSLPGDKSLLQKTLKAVVLMSQVKPEGTKSSMILPFVYDEKGIKDENVLLDCLEILTQENFISNEGGIYKPITKKESDVWTRIKGITAVTETAIRDYINKKIYKIFGARHTSGKSIISGKINDFSKDIAFVLKPSDVSNEIPNVYACIPFPKDIEKIKKQAFDESNNTEKLFIIPDIKYDNNSLYKATKFYLQMEEALKREVDFGIDQQLRIQIETKKDTAVDGDIDHFLEECYKFAVISYNGQENKDFSSPITQRASIECRKMLKKKYTMFFGKLLREQVDSFINKEILTPTQKLNAQYLKDLDLIDTSGAVNTGNRYYNEFLNSFPTGGFEKDGVNVVDEFTKGRYGWELDTVKILTALTFRNSDLKIAREGKVYAIPEDIQELVSKNGPFAPRRRDVFDSCKFTKINISDTEIRKAIKNIKSIDPNMTVAVKLKDVSDKIRMLATKTGNRNMINLNSEVIPDDVKSDLNTVYGIAQDILNRNDHEDIILTFNKKLDSEEMIKKFEQSIYISTNLEKVSTIASIYSMMKNTSELIDGKVKQECESYLRGESRYYDQILKRYKVFFNETYKKYQKMYEEMVNEIRTLPEWAIISETQRSQVLKMVTFSKVNDIVFDSLRVQNLGNLDDLRNLIEKLSNSKTIAIKQVHSYHDENQLQKQQEAQKKQGDPNDTPTGIETPTPKVTKKVNRVSKKLADYSHKSIINIDSLEKLSELDAIFNEIKKEMEKDLIDGKKITLEL